MAKYEEIEDLIKQCLELGNRKYGSNTQMNDNFRADLEHIEWAYGNNVKRWKQELLEVIEKETAAV